MKIALLSEKYTPDIGGLAISAERLGHLLASAGHEVRVFAPSSNLPASENQTLLSKGVSLTRFGAHKRVDDTLVEWFELIVKEHQSTPFDLIHAYFLPQAGFVAAYAGKYLSIPSVVSIRGNDIERAAFDPGKFSHVLYALQNASAVTTNASALVKKAKAFVDREIILIPNGINTEHFKPMGRNEALADALGLSSRVILSEAENLLHSERDSSPSTKPQSDTIPVIGFVGELRAKKGLATLLSSYVQVNKKQPSVLLIVGEVRAGDDKKAFDEFLKSNPDLKVIVTGYIPHKDIPAYYSLMDVFVHPSLRDGMPNAVLEAMACGKAVVATPVGGVLDVVKDRENSILVPVNDAESLSEAIEELLFDKGLRVKLGTSAHEEIQNRFTLQNELEANLNIYKKLGIKF